MHAGMRERDLSGVALAAPESALGGWKGVITSLSLLGNDEKRWDPRVSGLRAAIRTAAAA